MKVGTEVNINNNAKIRILLAGNLYSVVHSPFTSWSVVFSLFLPIVHSASKFGFVTHKIFLITM